MNKIVAVSGAILLGNDEVYLPTNFSAQVLLEKCIREANEFYQPSATTQFLKEDLVFSQAATRLLSGQVFSLEDWRIIVDKIITIATNNSIDLDGNTKNRMLIGENKGIRYTNSKDYLKAVIDYARNLSNADSKRDSSKINAALSIYPIGSNACLGGELSEIAKAKAQLCPPFMRMIMGVIDEVAIGYTIDVHESSERHLTGALLIALGADVRGISSVDAHSFPTFLSLSHGVVAEASLKIIQDFQKLLSIHVNKLDTLLQKHTWSDLDKIYLELNPIFEMISLDPYLGLVDSDPTVKELKPEDKKSIIRTSFAVHSIILTEEELGRDFENSDTLKDLCVKHRVNYASLKNEMTKMEERQNTFYPDATAQTTLRNFCESNLGLNPAKQPLTDKHVLEVPVDSLKVTLPELFGSIRADDYEAFSRFAGQITLVLENHSGGDPERREAVFQWVRDNPSFSTRLSEEKTNIRDRFERAIIRDSYVILSVESIQDLRDEELAKILKNSPPKRLREQMAQELSAERLAAIINLCGDVSAQVLSTVLSDEFKSIADESMIRVAVGKISIIDLRRILSIVKNAVEQKRVTANVLTVDIDGFSLLYWIVGDRNQEMVEWLFSKDTIEAWGGLSN